MATTRKISKGRPFGSKSFEPRSAALFGQVVRELRVGLGISQEALAHRAELERAHVGRIERGENQPTLWVILKLASSLRVRPGVLLDRTAEYLTDERESQQNRLL